MKFRKKPIVIEAEQFKMPKTRPTHPGPDSRYAGVAWSDFGSNQQHPFVVTIHGQRTPIEDLDWILPEPDGKHFYPCRPDIFAASYEPVS